MSRLGYSTVEMARSVAHSAYNKRASIFDPQRNVTGATLHGFDPEDCVLSGVVSGLPG
jgi:hypothetical protein